MRHPPDLLRPWTDAETGRLRDWRRQLHAEPELSMCEHDTQARVRLALAELGLPHVRTLGGTGLAVDLGPADRPALLLRADMDALPITEASGLAFASRRPGRMHACGHDAHMACLLAVAARLAAVADTLPGRVRLCWQPGEESGQGARAMIAEGLLDGVERALGLHVWSPLPVGTVSAAPGPVMAAVDEFRIVVRGQGGHGALPHTTVDAVVAAAQVVQALQTIAARRVDPFEPVVVTVGSIHGGSAFNVVAEEVVLVGTVRSFSRELGARLPELIAEVAQSAAAIAGARAETHYQRNTVALHNDAAMAAEVATAAAETPGVTAVDRSLRLMAGEDFAYIAERVPACFFFVGCGDVGAEPHHSPRFVVDEAALPIAAEVMLRSAWRWLTRHVLP